jgi:hypothetical protein
VLLHSHSAKCFFFENYFVECPFPGTRQSNFFKKIKITLRVSVVRHSAKYFFIVLKKITLPSAPSQALGKVFFKKINFAEALGKDFFLVF